jgi:hypothetical protein
MYGVRGFDAATKEKAERIGDIWPPKAKKTVFW